MDSPKKLGPFKSALSRRKLLQGGAAVAAAGVAAPLARGLRKQLLEHGELRQL